MTADLARSPLLIDIDERKRAEEALAASERNLKLIIDTIPALAWSARLDGSAEFFKQAEEALNRARSELAHVARVTTVQPGPDRLDRSLRSTSRFPVFWMMHQRQAHSSFACLDADPPNIEGARETARRTIRDANRAADVITRLRVLFSRKELSLESLDRTRPRAK